MQRNHMNPHCCAGLQGTKDEDYTLAINVLGIVAVLIANVTYLGYITPPGGPHPTWEACDYDWFLAFFILNGLAFIFSMVAIWMMVFMPLGWTMLGKPTQTWHSIVVWSGAAMVALAMLCFLVAFSAAGLVSVGYEAPDYTCGILQCEKGGVYCSRHTYARESRSLNNYQGRCYQVTNVSTGAYVRDNTIHQQMFTAADASDLLSDFPGLDISFPEIANFGRYGAGQSLAHHLDDNTCYFWGKEILSGFDDSNIHAKNTLCMVPTPFPDGSDARGGFAFDLFTNLAKQAVVSHEERAIWFVEYTAEPYNTTSKSYSASYLNGSSYSEHTWVVPALYTISKTMCDLEALQKGRFSFFSDSSSVSIINRENGVDNYDSVVENAATYYTATLADTASIIVHDELPYRCNTFDEALGDATWCRYSPTDKTQKFKGIDYKSTPRCQNDASCTRLAVQADGSYIRLSDLASLRGDGNHVLPDESETVTSVVKAVFVIMSIGGAVNIIIFLSFICLQICGTN